MLGSSTTGSFSTPVGDDPLHIFPFCRLKAPFGIRANPAPNNMSSPYLRLFRSELKARERTGDLESAHRFLEEHASLLPRPEERTAIGLEKARLQFLLGQWESCLASLDQVSTYDHLLSEADRSLFYLVSARLHQGYGDLNQALVFLELAVSEAEQSGGVALAESLIEIGALFHRVGEKERGSEFLQRAEELVGPLGEPEVQAQLRVQLGLLAFRSDNGVEAEEHYQAALSLLPNPRQPSVLRGEIRRYLGVLAATDGRAYLALEYQRDALADFNSLPYPLGSAKAYNSLGQTCLRLARYQEARFFLEKAEALCRELGAEAERATILGKLGRVYAETGQFEKAIEFQQQDLDSSSRFGNYRALAYALRNLGLSYRAKGDYEKAVAYLKDSRDRFAELEDPTPRVRTDMDLVSSLSELERWEEARHYLADALTVLELRLETTPEHVHAHYYSGLLARRRGEEREAEAALWQALELSQGFTIAPRQAAIHFELAELYREQRDRDGAVEHLVSAYRLARSCSLPRLLFPIVERLHELSPGSLFELLLNPPETA
jgi:tetratricopeptide (TPR) repeat protein